MFVKHPHDGFLADELADHLQRAAKQFLLAAGLITSVCVLFTTAPAAQRGFLTAVVEDCCTGRPEAHRQTLSRYGGIVVRPTTVDGLLDCCATWWADLHRPEELQAVVVV